ncbi:MAG: hypothetical protein FIA99_03690 [Ruminiclostridium sp.]|nr:hypothetical protein [Ruminiclostridium sp.]
MKKLILITLVVVLIIAASGCGKNKVANIDITTDNTVSSSSQNAGVQETEKLTEATAVENTEVESELNNGSDESENNPQLLQSASVDLDADGINEEVEALQIKVEGDGENNSGELEGILKIIDGNETKKTTFIKKQAGLTGVMTSIKFADLDGDGAKDIFLIIPESGAAFSLNYFFAYSHKEDKSYSFTTDSNLSEFAGGFAFKYLGDGKLEMKNDTISFTTVFDISDSPGLDKDEESNKSYESSWVEPTPVEISENSRIGLVNAKDGGVEIKVPLPVFGRATVDMIGEIDLYYAFGNNFKPVIRSFEVLDFSGEGHKSIGEWNKE